MVSTRFFIACLIIRFQIVVDLLRHTRLDGGSKVLRVVGPNFVLVPTAIVRIVARGQGMALRHQAGLQLAKADTGTCIREVAGTSPAGQIAEAKALS